MAPATPIRYQSDFGNQFESRWRFHPPAYAMNEAPLDASYSDDWQGLVG